MFVTRQIHPCAIAAPASGPHAVRAIAEVVPQRTALRHHRQVLVVVLQAEARVVAGQVAIGVVAVGSCAARRQLHRLHRVRAASAGRAGVAVRVAGVGAEVALLREVAHRVEAVVHRAAGRAGSDRLHQPVQLVVAVVLATGAAAQTLALEVAEHVVAVAQLAQGAAAVAVGQSGQLAGLHLVCRREHHPVAESLLRGLAARVHGITSPVFHAAHRLLLGDGVAVAGVQHLHRFAIRVFLAHRSAVVRVVADTRAIALRAAGQGLHDGTLDRPRQRVVDLRGAALKRAVDRPRIARRCALGIRWVIVPTVVHRVGHAVAGDIHRRRTRLRTTEDVIRELRGDAARIGLRQHFAQTVVREAPAALVRVRHAGALADAVVARLRHNVVRVFNSRDIAVGFVPEPRPAVQRISCLDVAPQAVGGAAEIEATARAAVCAAADLDIGGAPGVGVRGHHVAATVLALLGHDLLRHPAQDVVVPERRAHDRVAAAERFGLPVQRAARGVLHHHVRPHRVLLALRLHPHPALRVVALHLRGAAVLHRRQLVLLDRPPAEARRAALQRHQLVRRHVHRIGRTPELLAHRKPERVVFDQRAQAVGVGHAGGLAVAGPHCRGRAVVQCVDHRQREVAVRRVAGAGAARAVGVAVRTDRHARGQAVVVGGRVRVSGHPLLQGHARLHRLGRQRAVRVPGVAAAHRAQRVGGAGWQRVLRGIPAHRGGCGLRRQLVQPPVRGVHGVGVALAHALPVQPRARPADRAAAQVAAVHGARGQVAVGVVARG